MKNFRHAWILLLAMATIHMPLHAQEMFNEGLSKISGLDHKDRIPGKYLIILDDESIDKDADAKRFGENRLQVVDAYIQHMSRAVDGKVGHVYNTAFTGFSVTVENDLAMRSFLGDTRVKAVLADVTMRSTGTQYNAPWGLDRIDQSDLPLSGTYTYANSGAGVNAYIVDSGIRASHSEFSGRVVNNLDFYVEDKGGPGVISSDNTDGYGHGTHVAGILAGATSGVAKGASIHSLRVLNNAGEGGFTGFLAALDWLADNVQTPAVVNMSIGIYGLTPAYVDPMFDGLNAVHATGAVMVAASGNNNASACNHFPSAMSKVLSVGASSSNDQKDPWSNSGNCVKVYAPGTGIVSAAHNSNTGTTTMSGTSMASPFVAGAMALYLQSNPGASANNVKTQIKQTATLGALTNLHTNSHNRLLNVAALMGMEETTNPNAVPRAGLWHDPAKTGSGLHISKNASNQYAVYWFTYTNSGTPIWYLTSPGYLANGAINQTLYKVTWSSSTQQTTSTVVGNTRLEMTSNDSLRFKWNLDAIGTGSGFDDVVDMVQHFGNSSATGNWFEPAYSGWGVAVTHHDTDQGPDTVAIGFYYDGSQPYWTIGTKEGLPNDNGIIQMDYVTSTGHCPGCGGTPTLSYTPAGNMRLTLGYSSGTASTLIFPPSGNNWIRGSSSSPVTMYRLTGN